MMLVTTADGWYGTVRSVRWSPVLTAPVATSAALAAVRVIAGPIPGGFLPGELGLAFTAAVTAFIADDTTLDSAPATPIEARIRMAARAAATLPVVMLGWLLAAAAYGWVTPLSAGLDLANRGLSAAAVASTALALAALAGKLLPVESPGAAGIGAVACLGGLWQMLPGSWLQALPPTTVVSPTIMVVALATVALAAKEPTA